MKTKQVILIVAATLAVSTAYYLIALRPKDAVTQEDREKLKAFDPFNP